MTIRHIVLFRLNAGMDRGDSCVLRAAALSRTHAEHIPEILEWWAGFDCGGRSISCDFMVMGLFAGRAELDRYLKDPHHRRGAGQWAELASWVVIDVDEGESHVSGE
jgi:hypothetical protein